MNQINENCNPILVEHTRGGIPESFHRGVICVVDEAGAIKASVGDVKQVCYPRSALKYFQHIPLLLSGAFDHYGFTLKDLALMCGSHNGETMHTQGASHILNFIGMDASALKCGSQPPTLKADATALIREGKEPNVLHNNCSGKHSGFLAYCKFKGLSTENYLDPNHELHKEIRRITALFCEMNEEDLIMGIDGCSAPIFAMPVYNQAIAYKNLVAPEKFGPEIAEACHKVVKAVASYPEMIAGTKRYCTDLIAASKGRIIGKTGADGVYSIAIPAKKWGICIKIDDGKMGPQYNVAQALLEQLNLLEPEEAQALSSYLELDIRNWSGIHTGSTRVTAVIQNLTIQ